MATPAVNYNVFTNGGPTTEKIYRVSNGSLHSSGTQVSAQIGNARKQRPASVENPKRADGTRAPSDWYSEQAVATSGSGGMTVLTNGGVYRRVYSGYWGVPNISDAEMGKPLNDLKMQNIDNRALQKALLNLKDMKVNLAVALLEAKRTAALIGETARGIARGIEADNRRLERKARQIERLEIGLRKGSVARRKRKLRKLRRIRKGASLVGGLDEMILRVSWGWAPLFYDIYGALEQTANWVTSGIPSSITAHGHAKADRAVSLAPLKMYGASRLSREVLETSEVKYMLRVDVPNECLLPLAQTGVSNPATWVWEALWLSDVVDWFVTIGDSLAAVDAGLYVSFKEGAKTMFRKRVRSGNGQFIGTEPVISLAAPSWKFESAILSRSKLSSVPVIAWPSIRGSLGSLQMAQGISLLTTAFSRRLGIVKRIWR